MLIFLIGSLFIFLEPVQAATYHVSSTNGNDVCTGLAQTPYSTGTTACPIKTLSKLNTITLAPGDNILFKKGDTFYGSIIINRSGTAGSPITFSSYGSGEKPIITGFTEVSSWINLGNNIWESSNQVSALSTVNMVAVNGANTAMGRWPNLDNTINKGYLTYQTSTPKSITSASLSGTPNWTGAEAIVKSTNFSIERRIITSQSGATLNWATDAGRGPSNGFGFFIQNDIRTLDQQNEWYYNPTTKKISIYSTSQPTNVKVASVDVLLDVLQNYVTIDGLNFIGANKHGISHNTLDTPARHNLIVQNSDFSFVGLSGVTLRGSNISILNNTVNHSNGSGLQSTSNSSYVTISGNSVSNIGLFPGMGISYAALGAGNTSSNITIENNNISNVGQNGITFHGSNITVRNNFVDTYSIHMDDGGGIYSYTGANGQLATMNNILIEGNIIINGVGSPEGTDLHFPAIAAGIYLDNKSTNVEVSGNSLFNNRYIGLFLNDTSNINIHNNTVFGTWETAVNQTSAQFRINNGTGSISYGLQVNNNIFVAKSMNQEALYIWGTEINIPLIAFDNNYYLRPISDTNIFNVNKPGRILMAFAEWQYFSKQDVNSKKSPVAISSESDIFFNYNAALSSKTVALPWPAVDLDGVKRTGNITIAPYSSAIYLKDPNPSTPPPSSDTTLPVISAFTIPTTSSSLSISGITLIASDNTSVTGYKLTETSTKPLAGDAGWSASSPTTYSFSSQGTKTVYAWAKDAAGNVSNYATDSAVITITTPTLTPEYSTYSFGESSGTAIIDSSSSKNGTIVNTGVRTTGISGNGLSFSGNGHVSLGQVYGNIQDALTLSAWIKPNTSGLGYQGIIFHGGANIDTFALYLNYTLGVIGFKTQGTGTGAWVQVANNTIWNGSWHHLAATYNGSQKVIYLDGVALITTPATGTLDSGSGYNLLIGAGRDETPVPSSYLYQGLIDEVRIYNYALNSSQVSGLYTVQPVITHTLTYNINTNGVITGSTSQTVNDGESGTAIAAIADDGYHFVSWSDGSTANPRTDTNVTAGKSVSATFAINTYNLVSSASANGTIYPLGTTTKDYGASQIYTITPATGYHTTSVLVDGVSVGVASSYIFSNISVAHTISATFAPDIINTYTLTINKAGTGTGTVTGGNTYNSGTEVTSAATASSDSTFNGWSGDCSTSGVVTMDTNKTCIATFTLKTVASGGGGGGGGGGGSSSGGGTSSGGSGGTLYVLSGDSPTNSSAATSTEGAINTGDKSNNEASNNGSASVETTDSKVLEQLATAAKEFVAAEKKLVTKINNTLSGSLAGRLLLQVESHGEAWYLNPANKLKYYLGTPELAFSVMRTLGVGISNANLAKIKIADANLNTNIDTDGDGLSDSLEDAIGSDKNKADTDADSYDDKTELLNSYNTNGVNKLIFDNTFTNNQQGKIFLQVESHGEAWYVNPITKLRYYLGRPADAYALMRQLSLGITNDKLRKIGVGEAE